MLLDDLITLAFFLFWRLLTEFKWEAVTDGPSRLYDTEQDSIFETEGGLLPLRGDLGLTGDLFEFIFSLKPSNFAPFLDKSRFET